MKNVLLIGASGFIGHEVARQLSTSGVRLRLLVHRSQPDIQTKHGIELLHGGLQSFDWKALDDDPPDTIFHAARISGKNMLSRYWAGTRGYRANNRLLDWARSLGEPPHIVFTSGSLVYGSRGDIPADEHATVQPISFQRSYMPAEMPFLKKSGQPKNRISIVRPSWVYGSDSWFRQFFYRIMKQDGVVPQYGTGENFMSLVNLRDCASMIIEVARQSQGGTIYNLYVGEPMRQSEFCGTISRLTGKPVKILSYRWLHAKYGRAVAEALTFSLIVKSVHPLITEFKSSSHDHSKGLRETLNSFEE